MFDSIDSLYHEIINVQLLDLYFIDDKVKTHTEYFNDEYIYEMNRMSGLLKYYEDNNLIDDDSFETSENEGYTLDEVLELLVADIDIYSLIYRIPGINISDVEWELLFATIANYYKDKDYSYNFMDDMVVLNKMALARAMVYEEREITIESYLKSLKYIESDIVPISDIVEISRKLSDAFSIDVTSMLVNQKGEYGCIGKGAQLLIFDDSDEEEFEKDIKLIEKKLNENGYKINNIVSINEDNSNKDSIYPNSSCDNIVDIKTYKKKNGK